MTAALVILGAVIGLLAVALGVVCIVCALHSGCAVITDDDSQATFHGGHS